MTIIQLEYLLAVANFGSFSIASEHCFVTQPSLSMQIKALEEELGVMLLDRSKKPVVPTEAGEAVLEQVRNTLKEFHTIKEVVQQLKGEILRARDFHVLKIAEKIALRFAPLVMEGATSSRQIISGVCSHLIFSRKRRLVRIVLIPARLQESRATS